MASSISSAFLDVPYSPPLDALSDTRARMPWSAPHSRASMQLDTSASDTSASGKARTAKISSLLAKIKAVSSDRQQCEDYIHVLREKVPQLEQDLTTWQTEYTTLKSNTAPLNRRRACMLNRAMVEVEERKDTLDQARRYASEATTQLASLSTEMARYETELTEITRQGGETQSEA